VKIVISTRSGEIFQFHVAENARSLTIVRDDDLLGASLFTQSVVRDDNRLTLSFRAAKKSFLIASHAIEAESVPQKSV
jgi:hypothetical protein